MLFDQRKANFAKKVVADQPDAKGESSLPVSYEIPDYLVVLRKCHERSRKPRRRIIYE